MERIDREKLEYRQGTQAFIIFHNKILMFQGITFPNNMWSFPGGGLKENETPLQALERELYEEFPLNTFEIVSEATTPLIYDWSDEMIQNDLKTRGSAYRGQLKRQFLVRLKEPKTIVTFDKKEIRQLKWVNISEIVDYLLPERKEQTIRALKELRIVK